MIGVDMHIDEIILELNEEFNSWDQGISDDHYKLSGINKLCIYSSYDSYGMEGGSCWADSELRMYKNDPPEDHLEILDRFLELYKPDTTFLKYRKIKRMFIESKNTRSNDYYGNYSVYVTEYIILDNLIKLLEDAG